MPQAKGENILIVDDDRGLLRLIQRSLEREGWLAATASSGAAALEWLGSNNAKLMLLDLKLEDVSGKDLIQKLEQQKKLLPFVAITGQGDERVAVEMMKIGALDYLVKDAQFLEFLPTVVRRALSQIETQTRLQTVEKCQQLQHDVALVLAQANSLSEALPRVLEIICQCLKWDIGEVWDVDTHENVLRESCSWSSTREGFPEWSAATKKLRLSAGQGVVGRVWETRQPEFVPNLLEDSTSPRARLAARIHISCGFGFPILLRNQVAGVMAFFGQPRQPPTDDLLSCFTALGGHIGQLIERKEMERELLEISDREQFRIGRDLHDGLGQHLTALEFFSVNLAEELQDQAPQLVPSVRKIGEQLREAIRQTRALAGGLAPVSLHHKEGLTTALRKLADGTATMARIKCNFTADSPTKVEDQSVATNLYRIAQEAVNNALKHGHANEISISLGNTDAGLELTIRDNGRGFVAETATENGMGLRIMKYRSDLIGANLRIESLVNKGTCVTCRIPFRE